MIQEILVSLEWEEVEGSWSCEVGAGFSNLYMAMYGVSCEEWVGVDVESRYKVGGAFEVSS